MIVQYSLTHYLKKTCVSCW